jgi:hypothetical protein
MKPKLIRIVSLVFWLCLIIQNGQAQVRVDHPLAVKIGIEGFGIDYCLGENVGVDATTFLFYHTLKVRYLFLEKNSSPFIGMGIGSFSGGFGYGETNKWVVIHAGWEHAYRSFLIQFIVQHPISEENSKSHVPFFFNINFGIRIY